jgi:hypothetical protein
MSVEVTKRAALPDSGQAIDDRRKRLLEAAIKYVPWPKLVALATPYLPVKDKRFIEVLLRIYLIQRWFDPFSDDTWFKEYELRDIQNVPYTNVFSRIALLDKEKIAQIKLGMTLLKSVMLSRNLWEKISLVIDEAFEKHGLLLERNAEDTETVLIVSPEEVAAKQKARKEARKEAKARSRFFGRIRYWSFQAKSMGGILAFQYAVMLAAPQDVLTRFPPLGGFVRAMEWVCDLMLPSIVRQDNTIAYLGRAARHPELAQLLASLMIAMLPLYIYCCYRWLSFNEKRYRKFVLSPYTREVFQSNTDFMVGFFIGSLLLFILPLITYLTIFGFGHDEDSDLGVGALLWMEKALLNVGNGGVVGILFAVLGIQGFVLFASLVTAAFFCCWRDWFCFIREKLKKRTGD